MDLPRRRMSKALTCIPHRFYEFYHSLGNRQDYHLHRAQSPLVPLHRCPSCAESPFASASLCRVGNLLATWSSVTCSSSLILTHAPNHNPLVDFDTIWFDKSSQVVVSPCWKMVLPDVISACPSLCVWTLTPVDSAGARARCFPAEHRSSPVRYRVDVPTNPYNDFSTDIHFEAVDIRSCSDPQICSPR